MFETQQVRITDVEGIARRTGRDAFGATWTEFECDSLADSDSTECSICQRRISYGWLCLDGGEEVCLSHVEIVPSLIVDAFAGEIREAIESHNRLVEVRCAIGRALCDIGAKNARGKLLGWTEPAST